MAMPPISVSTKADSGVSANNKFDSSGWSVNFGSQTTGQVMPWYAWVALGLIAVIVLKKRGK